MCDYLNNRSEIIMDQDINLMIHVAVIFQDEEVSFKIRCYTFKRAVSLSSSSPALSRSPHIYSHSQMLSPWSPYASSFNLFTPLELSPLLCLSPLLLPPPPPYFSSSSSHSLSFSCTLSPLLPSPPPHLVHTLPLSFSSTLSP